MKFENTEVMNFKGAFRGLRNPLESWAKSDSFFGIINPDQDFDEIEKITCTWVDHKLSHTELPEGEAPIEKDSLEGEALFDEYWYWVVREGVLKQETHYDTLQEVAWLGPNDLSLAQRMIKAGTSDRKFLRQIFVSVDITAPLYWWKELDTYKVGTVANSTSTMHKLASTPITKDCFETDDFNEDIMMYEQYPYSPDIYISEFWDMFINDLEHLRQKYNETKDKRYWKELIRLLPESWLQTRTWTANYEILRNIYFQRKSHRLTEWHQFCDWIKTLPYAEELILYNPS